MSGVVAVLRGATATAHPHWPCWTVSAGPRLLFTPTPSSVVCRPWGEKWGEEWGEEWGGEEEALSWPQRLRRCRPAATHPAAVRCRTLTMSCTCTCTCNM